MTNDKTIAEIKKEIDNYQFRVSNGLNKQLKKSRKDYEYM